MKYAEQTAVPVAQSRVELERLLERYGATAIFSAMDLNTWVAVVGCQMRGRVLRWKIQLPEREDFELTDTGRKRAKTATEQAYRQAERQTWRVLVLVVKAKLEAVEAGISTFDEEFLANVVLPDGQTFGTWARSQLEAVGRGNMPKLLPDTLDFA